MSIIDSVTLRASFAKVPTLILLGLVSCQTSVVHSGTPAARPSAQSETSGRRAPSLDVVEAVAIAKAAAAQAMGEKMKGYVLVEVAFEGKYQRWRTFFDEKGPTYSFDGCFTVFVNDQTKETELQTCP